MAGPRVALAVGIVALAVLLSGGCQGQKPSEIDTAWRQVHANPESAKALIKLAEAYTTEEQYNDAFIHCRRAWAIDASSFDAAYQLAYTSLRLNDPHTGLTWIDRALAINPQSSQAVELKARLKMTSGDPRGAIPLFKKALRLDPQLGAALLNLVSAYKALGDRQAAVAAGAQAIGILPEQAAAHFAYADALEVAGQDQEAEEHYRQAIELQSDMAAAKVRLAQLLTRHNKFLEEAHELAKEAHKVDPGDGAAEATAGWALFLMGEEFEGIRTIESAARAHPFNHRIWILFAQALQRAGYEEEAKQAAAFAVRVGPKPARPPQPFPRP